VADAVVARSGVGRLVAGVAGLTRVRRGRRDSGTRLDVLGLDRLAGDVGRLRSDVRVRGDLRRDLRSDDRFRRSGLGVELALPLGQRLLGSNTLVTRGTAAN